MLVGTVAEGRDFRMFALAPSHIFCLANFDLHGRELGSFVGTIAEGLRLGLSASAPVIGSFFGLFNGRGFLSNDGSFHRYLDY